MGKRKATKDKMFITHSEHSAGNSVAMGGFKGILWKKLIINFVSDTTKVPFKKLPFNYCSLCFTPFETPVCTPEDGLVYEILNIVPHIKEVCVECFHFPSSFQFSRYFFIYILNFLVLSFYYFIDLYKFLVLPTEKNKPCNW